MKATESFIKEDKKGLRLGNGKKMKTINRCGMPIDAIQKNRVVKNKEKNLAIIGASVFFVIAATIGAFIRKL